VRIGDEVTFKSVQLESRYGDGPFLVSGIDAKTGGVKLDGISGSTFDPEDLVPMAAERATEPAKAPPAFRTSRKPVRGQERALEALADLLEALPEPQTMAPETGWRETSFYRFPVCGDCWCGQPVRHTLDGRRCENGHTT
jgi:hypothetical protein